MINKKIQEYDEKIAEFKSKTHSHDPQDEIHQLVNDLEQQNDLMKNNLKKIDKAEEDARVQLKKGIIDASDFINVVIDKIAARVSPGK